MSIPTGAWHETCSFEAPMRALSILIGALLAGALASCGIAPTDNGCTGKCDGVDDIAAALEDRDDAIARFLRSDTDIDVEGLFTGDFKSLVFGVSAVQGCPDDQIHTYVVADDLITGGDPFPRLISTVCSDNNSRAGEFFIAASFEDGATGDVDFTDVEMFAWDAGIRAYRFYAFKPSDAQIDQGLVELELDPARCEGCHTGPKGLDDIGMPMTPIMNELNRPWTHWNAEPGFESHDYALPDGIEDKPNFKDLAVSHQASASRFEEVVGTSIHEKVVISRMRQRRDPPDIDQIMGLLRPVFCEEHVNYVSEEFEAGVIRNAALIDPGVRTTYRSISDNWPWEWANIDVMRLGSLASAESLDQVPSRSFADVLTERQLVTTGAISAEQVLRAKAIDWKTPVFSEVRCGMWKQARERFATDPPDFADAKRNLEVMGAVMDEILQIDGRSLAIGEGVFVSIEDADSATLGGLATILDDPAAKAVGECVASGAACMNDLDSFGALVDAYVVETENMSRPRTRVRRLRNERLCEVLDRFPNRPSIPQIDCP